MEVWQIDLRNPGLLLPESQSWLDEKERARWNQRRFSEERRRFAAAHVGLRSILALHLGKNPWDLSFTDDAWKRPRLAEGPTFSFSRSGDAAILAIASVDVLGIDMEHTVQSIDGLSAADICSRAELDRFARRAPTSRELLRLWVRKEASAKALGRGLVHPLSQIVVPMGEIKSTRSGRVLVDVDGKRFLWRLYDLPVRRDAIAALVTSTTVGPKELNPRDFP